MDKLAIVDVETGGLDPTNCAVVQLAAIIVVNDKVVDTFNYKLKPLPEDVITLAALGVSGTTLGELQSYQDATKAHSEIKTRLSKIVNPYDTKDKMWFLGYNAWFDYQFVRQWFGRCNDKYFGSLFWYPPIDIMQMAALKIGPDRASMPAFKLENVATYFGVKQTGELHDAMVDVQMTYEIFKKLR